MSVANPAPGWYEDPAGGERNRWWDGERWTDALHPGHPRDTRSDTRLTAEGSALDVAPLRENQRFGGVVKSGPEPGWYEDPGGSEQLRYWSGSTWTSELQAQPVSEAHVGPEPSGSQLEVSEGVPAPTDAGIDEVEEPATQVTSDVVSRASPTQALQQGANASSAAGAKPQGVNLGQAITLGFQRGFDYSGRSSRPEYWWFALFAAIVTVLAQYLPLAIFIVLAIGIGVPHLAVGVRRLHDTGRSGVWLLCLVGGPLAVQLLGLALMASGAFGSGVSLSFIGTILGGLGGLVVLALMAIAGTPGPNRYGAPPSAPAPMR